MQREINIKVGERENTYPEGTSFLQIVKDFYEGDYHDVLLVYANGRLRELPKSINENATLEFETIFGKIGNLTYKRSLCLLLVKAIFDVAGKKRTQKVRILYHLGDGYYCKMAGEQKVSADFLNKVEARMRELVEKDIPIQKKSLNTDDAIARFHMHGMYDKEQLFKYRRVSKVNTYRIEDFEDYYYGYMVPSTGYLPYFKLFAYDEGFILQMPTDTHPKEVKPATPIDKLFCVLKESTKWGDMQDIETVGDLNTRITAGGVEELVLVQEALQEKKIAQMADAISKNPKIKFVMIAGPSSSGKTTFCRRLSVQLRAAGLTPHAISVDNYFVERDCNPKDENGNYDFECLEAVDTELFNAQLSDLLEGKEVVLPTFNFVSGHKEYTDPPTILKENDILVIEGIHCLNPKLTYSLPDENKYKIYISALTQLNIDEHNRIPSTDGRLIRRLVRDARTRGADARKTIRMWDSVRAGEDKNIFPFQEHADAMFNSALIYELAVLKPYVEALLFGIPRDCPEYIEAKRLLKFMDYFVGIGSENVPTNSLLREFVGGGCFRI
ncbi:MAG: nucleoside kinase [Lachnospiraceae bacterium]|jgi:uridine kinase|nr:nucleoside kinase [Lachnospiraceae bacterium]